MTLREARRRRGLTQEQLAAASGVDQPVISRYERGCVADPSFSIVCRLANSLRIDPRALRFGEAADEAVAS